MYCSESLICTDEDRKGLETVKNFLSSLPSNEKENITISKIQERTNLDYHQICQIVDILVQNKILIPYFGIVCRDCGMMIDTITADQMDHLPESDYCYSCGKDIPIDSDNLLCMFAVNELFDFFDKGQHVTVKNDAALPEYNQSDMVAAVKNCCDTIAALFEFEMHAEQKKEKEETARKKRKPLMLLIQIFFISLSVLIFVILNHLFDFEKNEYILTAVICIVEVFGAEMIHSIFE